MGSDKFCLRWNDFESNISVAFRELREDKDFFDVTLACEDEQLQAHKVILSACSPFFRTVLRRNPHAHPLLYLRGVKYSDLQAVLNFMYHGEVNVAQEELNSFLAVAEELKVKGLTQNQPGDRVGTQAADSNHRKPQHQQHQDRDLKPHLISAPPAAKRPRTSVPQTPTPTPLEVEVEVQEVAAPLQVVKSEPQQHYQVAAEQSLATFQEEEQGGYEEDYGGYGEDQGYDGGVIHTPGANKGSYREYLEECLRTKMVRNDSSRTYDCTVCGKPCLDLSVARFHLESKHFPNFDGYNCDLCQKFCKTKNALACHKVKCRRSYNQ